MDAVDWIGAVGGAIGGIAGIIGAFAGVRALRRADEANRLSVSANALSKVSNRIANEANEIARQTADSQVASNRLTHAASLVLPPSSPGIDDRQPSGRFVTVPIINLGSVEAFDVTVKLRRLDAEDWHSTAGPAGIPAGETREFRLPIRSDLFRRDEGSPVIDYRVRYKDKMDHHEKWFRLQLFGTWETSWSFRLLDVKLDARRVPIPDAPILVPGIAYAEDEASP